MILSSIGISDSIPTPVQGAHFWYDPGNLESYPGTGSTLFDISGNGNNATLVNSPFFVSGQGGYFTLDGSNDYIRSPNVYNSGNDVHTIEVWIRPTANDDCIWSDTNTITPDTSYHFSGAQINASGSDNLIRVGLWNGSGITSVNAGTSAYLNGWIQLVRTYDGTTLRSYINGVAGGSTNVTFSDPNPWYILFGATDFTTIGGATAGYFAGNYGTIRYYRTALSAQDVLQNFEATKVLYTPSPILNLDATNSASYPGTSTTWTDLSFPQYNATLVNAPTFNSEGYFDFNGTDEYASIAHTAALKPTVEITIEQWLSADDWVIPSSYRASLSCTQGGGYSHNIISGGIFRSLIGVFIGGSNVYQEPEADVSLFTGWHHFITTFDGRYTKLYVDGILADTVDIGTSGNSIYYSVNNSLIVGAEAGSSTTPTGQYWDGKISTTLIYNNALSANEVLRRFNQTKDTYFKSVITNGLLVNLDAGNSASYPGSGTTWTNLVDNSTYTIFNGSFDSGDGGSIVFNGGPSNGTYVPIGTPLSSGTNYSMEAWVRADVVTSSRNILSSASNVFWNNGSTLSGGVGGSFTLVTSSSFPANTWRHVMLTFNDSINTMTLYINGVQVSQNTSVTQSYISETLRIGSHFFNGNPVSFWDGKIAQVRVYNTELSSADVLTNFNATKSRYGL